MASSLAETLQDLQASNGLQLAAIVTADGLVVDAASNGELDVESVCSVAANGLLLMDALGQELGDGSAEMTTLEYAGHIAIMAPLDAENLLVLIATAGMNLGHLRLVLRRHLASLAQFVG
jgi:predicted regulator of Ras-like GTPase activity (Roadblock/LC7/MglB family)